MTFSMLAKSAPSSSISCARNHHREIKKNNRSSNAQFTARRGINQIMRAEETSTSGMFASESFLFFSAEQRERESSRRTMRVFLSFQISYFFSLYLNSRAWPLDSSHKTQKSPNRDRFWSCFEFGQKKSPETNEYTNPFSRSFNRKYVQVSHQS